MPQSGNAGSRKGEKHNRCRLPALLKTGLLIKNFSIASEKHGTLSLSHFSPFKDYFPTEKNETAVRSLQKRGSRVVLMTWKGGVGKPR